MSRLALLVALLGLLASCALFDHDPQAPAAARAIRAASPLEDLAAYVAALNAMTERELAAEARQQRDAAARSAGDLARTKAAIALMLAHLDDAEVVALLEPVAKRDSGDAAIKAMASFLHAMATDRRRLRESAATVNAKLREERKAQEALRGRVETAQERAAQLQERASQLQERAAQLQQKLDALTELEKSLSDRPTASR